MKISVRWEWRKLLGNNSKRFSEYFVNRQYLRFSQKRVCWLKFVDFLFHAHLCRWPMFRSFFSKSQLLKRHWQKAWLNSLKARNRLQFTLALSSTSSFPPPSIAMLISTNSQGVFFCDKMRIFGRPNDSRVEAFNPRGTATKRTTGKVPCWVSGSQSARDGC